MVGVHVHSIDTYLRGMTTSVAASCCGLHSADFRHRISADLNSEQKALLDFLVLAKGKYFVGFGSSTFSFYLREHRALQVLVHLPCCTTRCLQSSSLPYE
jgi:hypothetical protein